ncbi:MAG: FAD binding domain-containing protein [Candidatus Dormibacteria bacterium]
MPPTLISGYAAGALKSAPFAYLAPLRLEDALDHLAEHGDDGRVLAGGQTLIPLLALRLARPGVLVDLGRIAGLATIQEREGWLVLGSMTRELQAERSALVARRWPLLGAALRFIGHPAIRSRGTVGGSLAHADPAAELPAVALALQADLVAQSRRGGERTIAALDFFLGPYTTALAADEILTEIRIPGSSGGFSFQEVARRHGDFALVGVAATVELEQGRIRSCRVALTGVSDRPVLGSGTELGIVGEEPTQKLFQAVAQRLAAVVRPPADLHGTARYRRQLVSVLVPRALEEASSRAAVGPIDGGGLSP